MDPATDADDEGAAGTGGAATVGPNIFISYRREDTAQLADRLAGDLKEDLGLDHVFRDTDDLRPGLEFESEIERRLSDSRMTVALIGPAWAGATGGRLDEPDDWVRRELRHTIEIGNDLLPVSVDGGRLPDSVPPDIERVGALQRLAFDTGRYSDSYQELLAAVWYLSVRSSDERQTLIVSDDSDRARLATERLVEALEAEDLAGARELSRVAVGLRSVRVGAAAQRWPDVVVLVDGEPSPVVLARVRAIASRRPVQRLALVGVGSLLGVGAAGVAEIGAAQVARIESAAAPLGGGSVTSVSAGGIGDLTAWVDLRPRAWWAGLLTGGNAAIVGGAAAVTAVGVTVGVGILGSDDPDPSVGDRPVATAEVVIATPAAPAAPTTTVVIATTAPPVAPTTEPMPLDELKRSDDPPVGVEPVLETPVQTDLERCDLVLDATFDGTGATTTAEAALEVGEIVDVCAVGFLPFDIELTVTGPDGAPVLSTVMAALPGNEQVPAHQTGSGWETVVLPLPPGSPTGDYAVFGENVQDGLNAAAREATRAAGSGGPPRTGGPRTDGVIHVGATTGPRVLLDAPTVVPGTPVELELVGYPASSDAAVGVYRHVGVEGTPPMDVWEYVTRLDAVTDQDGRGAVVLPTRSDDPPGRYLLYASDTATAELTLAP